MNPPASLSRDVSSKPKKFWRGGFSLVEVVLAIGVLSFAVIPMIAMIGGSLQSYRSASQELVRRQILTQIAADAQQAPASDLQAQPNRTAYFDVEGNPVASEAHPDKIYTAVVEVLPQVNPLTSTSLFQVRIRVESLGAESVQQTSLQVFPQS